MRPLEGRARLDCEGGALMMGLWVLKEKEECDCSLYNVRTQLGGNPEETSHQKPNMLHAELLVKRTEIHKFLLFKLPSLWGFVMSV